MFPIQDSVPSRSVPVVTRALILINVLVFFLELMLPRQDVAQLFYLFGLVPARFTHPDWAAYVGFPVDSYWPILTHQFLHGGWLHIVANMWTLWIFGDNVEDEMGSVRFAIFYLLCGSIAGLTHLRLIVLFPIIFFPFFFEVPAVLYLVLWFFINLFSGTAALAGPQLVGGIAWWAHVGGFVSGMLLCRLFVRRRRQLQPDEYGLEWAWEPRKR